MKNNETPEITITVIYDNYRHRKDLEPGWGFSCIVEFNDTRILFDTGADGDLLLENMQKLKIDPGLIDTIFLSHEDFDHVGGVLSILSVNSNVTVYTPRSFSSSFKSEMREAGARVQEIHEFIELQKNMYSTGELGISQREQAMVLRTKGGLVIITGCAHPGIVHIVQRAKEELKDNVLLVMGGFHLMGMDNDRVMQIINAFRSMGVQYAGPCHCTGESPREMFRKEMGSGFVEVGTGIKIIIDQGNQPVTK